MGNVLDSGKLYGKYRCKTRNVWIKKIPDMERTEKKGFGNVIVAGILNNSGNSIDDLKAQLKDAGIENSSVPRHEFTSSREKLIHALLQEGKNINRVKDCLSLFYALSEMPSEATRMLRAQEDIKIVERYITSEERSPVKIGHPIVRIDDISIRCGHDFVFVGYKEFEEKHKVGKKTVKEFVTRPYAEIVKVMAKTPDVTQGGKGLDTSVQSRLELYVMLEVLNSYCKNNGLIKDDMVLISSYYFLKKKGESVDSMCDDFFDKKGGNIVSLTVYADEAEVLFPDYHKKIHEFVDGSDVCENVCETCSMSAMCHYKGPFEMIENGNTKIKKSLPVLSKPQSDAVNQLKGYIRCNATAGSGKTTVMAYRITNLLASGVKPSEIGCFTFTNTGADEMRSRISDYCRLRDIRADIDKMVISTIHGFGNTVIQEHYWELGFSKRPVLIDDIQKSAIIEEVLRSNEPVEELILMYKNFYSDFYNSKGIMVFVSELFAVLKENRVCTCDDFKELFPGLFQYEKTFFDLFSLYTKYQDELFRNCLLEYVDLEVYVLKLLEAKPDLFYGYGIKHISVDEYQDTSFTQFQIFDAMRRVPFIESFLVVGDADQSIYRFRGAEPKLIIDFFKMVGESGTDINLMDNYRSTKSIVDFAAKIVEKNTGRLARKPRSIREQGCRVNVYGFEKTEEEYANILNIVKQKHEEGIKYEDIAILAATNGELEVLSSLFEEEGIQTVSLNPELLMKNSNVLAAIALAKYISLGGEIYGMTFLNAVNGGTLFSMDGIGIQEKLVRLDENLDNAVTSYDIFSMMESIGAGDEIYAAFMDMVKTALGNRINDSIQEICNYCANFEKYAKKQDARREGSYKGVVLTTAHSSKGKEWPVVICSVTKFHKDEMQKEDVEEKRRLLFVACTRAKDELYISGLVNAYGSKSKGYVANMFLQECFEAAEDTSDMKIGTEVA